MRVRFSPAIFSIAFCCTYIAAFALNRPLFVYYPLHGDLSWGPQVLKGAGPGMAWYGLMTDAALGASLLSLLIPARLPDSVFRHLWLIPCAAMLACVFLLRQFFK